MKQLVILISLLFSISLFSGECHFGDQVVALTPAYDVVDRAVMIDAAKKMIKKTMQIYSEDFGMGLKRAHQLFIAHEGEINTIVHDNEIYYLTTIYPTSSEFGHLYRARDLKLVAHAENGFLSNCDP